MCIRDRYKNADITYIPNGIDEKKNLVPNKIKEKFNLEKDQYILFLARLVPEKGAHYLIDAFKNLETSKKLVISGGSSHSDDYVNELKEKEMCIRDSLQTLHNYYIVNQYQ